MLERIEKVIKIESVDEANQFLENGWVLLKYDSDIIDGVAKYFFLLGKKSKSSLEKWLDDSKPEQQE